MTFQAPAFDFDISCVPAPVEVERLIPAFASSDAVQGFVAGQAMYGEPRETVRITWTPMTVGDRDDLIYQYRLAGAGTRWMWLRIPGDREPVEARFAGALIVNQLNATAYSVSLEFEVRA